VKPTVENARTLLESLVVFFMGVSACCGFIVFQLGFSAPFRA
jgi:hypothetical protein